MPVSVCPGGGRLDLLLSVLTGSATESPDSVAWPLALLVVLGSTFPLALVLAFADISTASARRGDLPEASLFGCGAVTGSKSTADLRAATGRYLGVYGTAG